MMLVSKKKFELKRKIEDKLWRKYLAENQKKDKFHANELLVTRNTYATRINDLIKFQEKELEVMKTFYANENAKVSKAKDIEIENIIKAKDREILILKNQHELDIKNTKALAAITTLRAEGRLEELEMKHAEVNAKDTKLTEKLKKVDVQVAAFKEKRKQVLRDIADMMDIERHLDNIKDE